MPVPSVVLHRLCDTCHDQLLLSHLMHKDLHRYLFLLWVLLLRQHPLHRHKGHTRLLLLLQVLLLVKLLTHEVSV